MVNIISFGRIRPCSDYDMQMCRNSGYKDPAPISEQDMQMCRNSGYKDPAPISEQDMQMCRNSGYKDPAPLSEQDMQQLPQLTLTNIRVTDKSGVKVA